MLSRLLVLASSFPTLILVTDFCCPSLGSWQPLADAVRVWGSIVARHHLQSMHFVFKVSDFFFWHIFSTWILRLDFWAFSFHFLNARYHRLFCPKPQRTTCQASFHTCPRSVTECAAKVLNLTTADSVCSADANTSRSSRSLWKVFLMHRRLELLFFRNKFVQVLPSNEKFQCLCRTAWRYLKLKINK